MKGTRMKMRFHNNNKNSLLGDGHIHFEANPFERFFFQITNET